MLEQALIAHGAPTLARLKTGNLFNLACPNPERLAGEMLALAPTLRAKGVELTVLRAKDGRYLLYLYRPQARLSGPLPGPGGPATAAGAAGRL